MFAEGGGIGKLRQTLKDRVRYLVVREGIFDNRQ
jgi:hypothetical protein